jgi:hypothetical protein
MNDKEWLKKIKIAYSAYVSKTGPQPDIEDFIHWLYKEYGIIEPQDSQ